MKNRALIVFSVLLSFAVLLIACNGVQNRPEKERQLTSLIDSLQLEFKAFEEINTEQLQAISDTIQVHLNDIQRLYSGEQKRELADPLSRYRSILKLLPDVAKRGQKVNDEYQRTVKQLSDLREAVSSGATVDALGTKIDEAYLSKTMKEEGDVARLLIAEMKQISERAVQVHEQYAIYFPVAKQVVDSLRTAPVLNK